MNGAAMTSGMRNFRSSSRRVTSGSASIPWFRSNATSKYWISAWSLGLRCSRLARISIVAFDLKHFNTVVTPSCRENSRGDQEEVNQEENVLGLDSAIEEDRQEEDEAHDG